MYIWINLQRRQVCFNSNAGSEDRVGSFFRSLSDKIVRQVCKYFVVSLIMCVEYRYVSCVYCRLLCFLSLLMIVKGSFVLLMCFLNHQICSCTWQKYIRDWVLGCSCFNSLGQFAHHCLNFFSGKKSKIWPWFLILVAFDVYCFWIVAMYLKCKICVGSADDWHMPSPNLV